MEITWTDSEPPTPEGFLSGRKTITITVEASEDPHGLINGLLIRDRLAPFLRIFAQPVAHGGIEDDHEMRAALTAFGFVAQTSTGLLDALMLRARDQFGMGWGSIGNALDLPRSTVKSRIERVRREHAREGDWYDRTGLHRGDYEMAEQICKAREKGGE